MSLPDDAFTTIVHPEVLAYLGRLEGSPEDPIVDRMEAHARAVDFPTIGRATGRWLELLTRAVNGHHVFEFGSGFGFSAYFFARAVGEGGRVIGAERDAHEHEVRRELWADHPLARRIDIRQGDAAEVFDRTEGLFDVILIDCGKDQYVDALERAIPRLRSGGLLLADNALWGGKVARSTTEASTLALQAFNERLFAEPRLVSAILPVGDGLAVGLKR